MNNETLDKSVSIVCGQCCGLMYIHKNYYNGHDWWVCSTCGNEEPCEYHRGGYPCPKCDQELESDKELLKHWKEIHKLPQFMLQAAQVEVTWPKILKFLKGKEAMIVHDSIIIAENLPKQELGLLGDIHTRIASEMFNVPLGGVTPIMRTIAKSYTFRISYGVNYGMKITLQDYYQEYILSNYKVTTA